MNLQKIDNRIKLLIESGVANHHRSLFIIVGDKAKEQIPNLHYILSQASVRAQPTVLWCYKKDKDGGLGFSTTNRGSRKKKQLDRKIRAGGNVSINDNNPIERFVATTKIRYCFYADTHKILGNTFGMCVLQDFEAITPNILARAMETVEGGGLIILLLKSVSSLRQLYTLSMDVHARYRTEAHEEVVPRFNERFILSLGSCQAAIVMDQRYNILPISSKIANLHSLASVPKAKEREEDAELKAIKQSMQDTQPVGSLINCCRTVDQAHALLQFIDAITERTLRSTVTLTAARGRGKSAALGLAIASAVAHGYANIFVTSPSPENLKTLFEFIIKGFEALGYAHHTDYEKVESTNPTLNKAVVRLNIFRNHRQTIQYVSPNEAHKLGQAELVVIDEAAAIPLPLVRELIGPYLVFMASTINGYEGTGRALSLKLIDQLKKQSASGNNANGRKLRELQLNESIRYKPGDPVEAWLNELLCLNVSVDKNYASYQGGVPLPKDCELYYINRDTLFCYHKASEEFLQRVMAIMVASHYKNSPNDLQMLSDAPGHHIFCLLGPVDNTKLELPEVYCVVQVCLEGAISKKSAEKNFSHGMRPSGDMIPWTVAQQFQDNNFVALSGARVVRIAVHPNYQNKGYGSRALSLLEEYYKGMIPLTDDTITNGAPAELNTVQDEKDLDLLKEKVKPRSDLPPLLYKLTERRAERVDWLGTSFGLTIELLRFWKRAGYVPVYLRQTENELTGEHSAILLRGLEREGEGQKEWIREFFVDFRRRFISLLAYQFRTFKPVLALDVLNNKAVPSESFYKPVTVEEAEGLLTKYDLRRLDAYSRNLVDHHVITDLLPILARMFFLGQLGGLTLSAIQTSMLIGLGLQNKTVEEVAVDLNMPVSHLLGFHGKTIKKFSSHFQVLVKQRIGATLNEGRKKNAGVTMEPLATSLDEELQEAAEEYEKKSKEKKKLLKDLELDQYKIAAEDADLDTALNKNVKRKGTEPVEGYDKNRKKAKKNFGKGLQKKKQRN